MPRKPSRSRRPLRYRGRVAAGTTTIERRTLDERDVKILEATEQLIADYGYDRVRLIDIADRAGVSVGSLQHRFRTREALMRATVERIAAHNLPPLQFRAEEIGDPYEHAVALIEHTLRQVDPTERSSLLWLELVAVAARNEDLRGVLNVGNLAWEGAFENVIEAALESGRIHSELNARELTMVIVGLTDGYLTRKILDPDSIDPDHEVRLVLAVFHSLVEIRD